MKIIETFIVWNEKSLNHVKLHYCKYWDEEKFFIEKHDGKLKLISPDEARALTNRTIKS
jgi:hypothetical protein